MIMRDFATIMFAAVLLVTGCANDKAAHTAPDRDEILATVDAFFIALATGDADAVEAMLSPEAITVAMRPEDGARPPHRGRGADLVANMRSGKFPHVVEPYWSPTILQRGPLAVVWAPYQVSVEGALVHCGIDVFTMSRDEDDWKIDAVSWTAEPSACDALWPEDKSVFRPRFPTGE